MGKKHDYGRESTAVLATTAVLALGLLGCLFTIAASVDDPFWPFIWCVAVFLLFAALLFMSLRARQDIQSGGLRAWFKGTQAPDLPDYSPRRVRTSRDGSEGGNAPPDADEVRDLKESSPNTWVPSSVPREKR